ncbi:MAG TPA: hypothetical protein DCQ32_00230 [Cyanobacteria bacterium UBA8156]|jgi:hypothetical protein|nr:hypothetical protein [Cyanobacteria bacterium UBA8156]
MYVRAQLLLGLSMLLAISFVACVFELASGEPDWGPTATWATLVGSLTLTIVTFVRAVQMARDSLK